ncbi:hypothetical protein [Streptomyces sp. NPDC005407]
MRRSNGLHMRHGKGYRPRQEHHPSHGQAGTKPPRAKSSHVHMS